MSRPSTTSLSELAPLLRRALELDAGCLARVRTTSDMVSVLVRLPFDVLVQRGVALCADSAVVPADPPSDSPAELETSHRDASGSLPMQVTGADWPGDAAVSAAALAAWIDSGCAGPSPAPMDALWRSAVPPVSGWRRIETLPDSVVRDRVRAGALMIKDLPAGIGGQPDQRRVDALLDSEVITVRTDGDQVTLRLRTLTALTRMGFLARGSVAHVDLSGRWTRLAADYGSVFAERAGLVLRPA